MASAPAKQRNSRKFKKYGCKFPKGKAATRRKYKYNVKKNKK